MEQYESEFWRLGGMDAKYITSKYTMIKMNDSPLAVRTTIYDEGGKEDTLLMTHGYGVSCVFFWKIVKPLAQHYRIVMFDNLGWGLNTRVEDVGDALESHEKSEAWVV